MKKLLLITTFCMITNAACAINCPEDVGDTITGQDGKTQYCVSKNHMNWWRAQAWCLGLGQELFTLDECAKVSGTATCPRLSGGVLPRYIWTQNVPNKTEGYFLTTGASVISNKRSANSYGGTGHNFYALCK